MVNSFLLLLLSAAAGLQDPTRPLTPMTVETARPRAQHPQQARFRLQAIFTGGGRPSAIIDGRRYQTGDAVANYRLVRIQPDHILLEGQGEALTLTLFPSLSTPSNQ
ncbi:hypothetical protein HNR62_000595 [Oceanisphaera litoralis]|uniref:hypothetical protein n=1 Tax=Oceanisphaera litoralis TaxID=225144 RepID=UPI001957DF28|nr:hypothetical protein [Oceanisphaera litoralis]MBM7454766.1 hypothetical protein [Oceanisphaera litoralis]